MTKKLLALLILCSGLSYADMPATVERATSTVTNEMSYISSSTYLDKVIITTSIPGGILGLYNSTYSYTPSVWISSIPMFAGTGGGKEIDFGNLQVKGIFYVTTGNGATGVTILWKK